MRGGRVEDLGDGRGNAKGPDPVLEAEEKPTGFAAVDANCHCHHAILMENPGGLQERETRDPGLAALHIFHFYIYLSITYKDTI